MTPFTPVLAADVPLFDEHELLSIPVAIITNGDTARTRRGDPETSHRAGDKSQLGLTKLRLAVLRIVATDGPMTGSAINDEYADRMHRGEVALAHPDSPRKRAGELHNPKKGLCLLDEDGTEIGVFGSPETVYRINAAGWAALHETADNK